MSSSSLMAGLKKTRCSSGVKYVCPKSARKDCVFPTQMKKNQMKTTNQPNQTKKKPKPKPTYQSTKPNKKNKSSIQGKMLVNFF